MTPISRVPPRSLRQAGDGFDDDLFHRFVSALLPQVPSGGLFVLDCSCLVVDEEFVGGACPGGVGAEDCLEEAGEQFGVGADLNEEIIADFCRCGRQCRNRDCRAGVSIGCVVDACAVVEVAGVYVVEDRVGFAVEELGAVDVGQFGVEDGAHCDPNG